MKKTLKNIRQASGVRLLVESKTITLKGGGRYIPPPKPIGKPGNNQ